MSDIIIRLDGILLVLTILATGAVFLIVALVAGVVALRRQPRAEKVKRVCARAALMAVGSMMVAGGTTLFMEKHGPWTGPEWLDWLSLPWLAIIVCGLWSLARVR